MTSYAWADWVPPIGIPNPDWGIDTTHLMFSGDTYNYVGDGGVLTYRESSDGPYTHYIKPSDGSSTDVGNPYGTVTTPRKTVTANSIENAVAGSVFQIWGPYELPGLGTIQANGTAADPVFIIGKEGYEPTSVNDRIFIDCDYLIIEGIEFQFGEPSGAIWVLLDIGFAGNTIEKIAIRKCEFSGGLWEDGAHTCITIRNNSGSAGTVSDVIIYDNHFHNMNEERPTDRYTAPDAIGVSCEAYSSDVWIVDNLFHNIGGDGVIVSQDQQAASGAAKPHHIYIGRNTFHDNYENGVDLKKCEDIIISQNIAYNFGEETGDLANVYSRPFRQGHGDTGSDHAGGRQRIWTIFNLVYNCSSSENEGGGAFVCWSNQGVTEPLATEIYFIGNVAYDIHETGGKAVVFQHWSQKKMYYVNNTIYDADMAGAWYVRDHDDAAEEIYIVNNIFSDSWTATGNLGWMFLGSTEVAVDPSFAPVTMSNNLFYRTAGAGNLTVRRKPNGGYDDTSYTLAEFGAWKAAFVVGTSEDNPDFVNAGNNQFQLLAESPAIDAGVDVETEIYDVFYALYGIDIKVDFDGNARTEEWDIGAFQFQSEEPPGPPDYHDHYVYVDPDATGANDGGRDAVDPNDPSDEDNWTDAYESLNEAETGEDGTDLTALNRVLIFCCRNSGGSADTAAVIVDGTTTDSTRYIQIEAYSGDRHAGVYDTDKYHLTGTDVYLLQVEDNYVRIVGLQAGVTVTANNAGRGFISFDVDAGGALHVYSDCIAKAVAMAGTGHGTGFAIWDADVTAYIYNCISYGFVSGADTDFMGIYNAAGTTSVWNTTINNCYRGCRELGGTITFTNCLIFENTDDLLNVTSATYCALDDADAGTGNFQITQTADDYAALVVDADGGDYDVTDASSELWDAGTDDPGGAGQGDPDIAGVTRETNWDIGAFEGPVQAGGSNPYYPLLHAIMNQ